MTHAHDDCARCFGYEVHVLHENSTHDLRRRRGIHGSLGLRVPTQVLYAKRTRDMRRGQPKPLPQRTFDDASSSVAQYQAAWRGMVQYDRMAYHLHLLQHRTHVMEVSLGQTLAKKDNMTCHKISRRYGATIQTEDGDRKVLRATMARAPPKQPCTTHCGAVSLRGNKWVSINDAPTKPIWSGRSEGVERLLAHTCELCGSQEHMEVHHMRKRADLASQGQDKPPSWKRRMVARQRKSFVVCRRGQEQIPYGRYDGPSLRSTGYRRAS